MRQGRELEARVVGLVDQLPPAPGNVERLLRAAADPAEARAGVLEIVRQDPGLCVQLLRLANSCGGLRGAVRTIDEAADTIGVDWLVQMIGAHYLSDSLERSFADMANLPEYFEHSRSIGRACRALAGAAGLSAGEVEMLAVAGLIHDVGRLVILLASDQAGAPLIGTTWDQMARIAADEKALLGLNHCDVGSLICGKWGFSADLREGVLRHHSPLVASDFNREGGLIFAAHFVSASDFTGDIVRTVLPPRLMDRLALTYEAFDGVRSRLGAGG